MAPVTTTIKTELCSFTDYRVYPGRGQKFAAKDGKVYFFFNSKAKSLHRQKVKAARVKWTLVSRFSKKTNTFRAGERPTKSFKPTCHIVVETEKISKSKSQS